MKATILCLLVLTSCAFAEIGDAEWNRKNAMAWQKIRQDFPELVATAEACARTKAWMKDYNEIARTGNAELYQDPWKPLRFVKIRMKLLYGDRGKPQANHYSREAAEELQAWSDQQDAKQDARDNAAAIADAREEARYLAEKNAAEARAQHQAQMRAIEEARQQAEDAQREVERKETIQRLRR